MKEEVFLKNFKGRVRFNEPLREHTSFRIGGNAKYWTEPKDISDLLEVFRFSKEEGIETFIIGEGTNLLAKDTGFEGVIINLSSAYFKRIYRRINDIDLIHTGAGVRMEELRLFAQESGLEGLEFLAGIPGSIGGGLIMNAGVKDLEGRRIEIGDFVWEVNVLDREGKEKVLKKEDLEFGYRASNLEGFIILGASFRLKQGDRSKIIKDTEFFLKKRSASQELRFPSAGCIFKNPLQGKSAGWLLERCGFKGKRIGDAQFSNIHANFIINLGQAHFDDVFSLIEVAKKRVKEDFGVELELEVKIL